MFEGKVLRQINNKGFFACVSVTICETANGDTPASHVSNVFEFSGFEISEWLHAAELGATLALAYAKSSRSCEVCKVAGVACDSNATLIAIAAIRAVWLGIQYEPLATVEEQLEQIVLSSHCHDFKLVDPSLVQLLTNQNLRSS